MRRPVQCACESLSNFKTEIFVILSKTSVINPSINKEHIQSDVGGPFAANSECNYLYNWEKRQMLQR